MTSVLEDMSHGAAEQSRGGRRRRSRGSVPSRSRPISEKKAALEGDNRMSEPPRRRSATSWCSSDGLYRQIVLLLELTQSPGRPGGAVSDHASMPGRHRRSRPTRREDRHAVRALDSSTVPPWQVMILQQRAQRDHASDRCRDQPYLSSLIVFIVASTHRPPRAGTRSRRGRTRTPCPASSRHRPWLEREHRRRIAVQRSPRPRLDPRYAVRRVARRVPWLIFPPPDQGVRAPPGCARKRARRSKPTVAELFRAPCARTLSRREWSIRLGGAVRRGSGPR